MKTIRDQPCPEPPSPDLKVVGEESLLDRERFCKRGLTVRRGALGQSCEFSFGGMLALRAPMWPDWTTPPRIPSLEVCGQGGHGETHVGFGGWLEALLWLAPFVPTHQLAFLLGLGGGRVCPSPLSLVPASASPALGQACLQLDDEVQPSGCSHHSQRNKNRLKLLSSCVDPSSSSWVPACPDRSPHFTPLFLPDGLPCGPPAPTCDTETAVVWRLLNVTSCLKGLWSDPWNKYSYICRQTWASPGAQGKESAYSTGAAGGLGWIPGSGRAPGKGNGNPLQYSCLEYPLDRGAWQATVHRIEKSWTWL